MALQCRAHCVCVRQTSEKQTLGNLLEHARLLLQNTIPLMHGCFAPPLCCVSVASNTLPVARWLMSVCCLDLTMLLICMRPRVASGGAAVRYAQRLCCTATVFLGLTCWLSQLDLLHSLVPQRAMYPACCMPLVIQSQAALPPRSVCFLHVRHVDSTNRADCLPAPDTPRASAL